MYEPEGAAAGSCNLLDDYKADGRLKDFWGYSGTGSRNNGIVEFGVRLPIAPPKYG